MQASGPDAMPLRCAALLDSPHAAALIAEPAAREALCAALWAGAEAGVLPRPAIDVLLAEARRLAAVEDAALAPHRAAAAAGDPAMAALLAAGEDARRRGRLAALAGAARLAAPPPGPGAAEENAIALLSAAGAPPAGAAQVHLGALTAAATGRG